MYRHDADDRRLIEQRAAQLRDQLERYRAGELSADELRPLRLQNGLYIERNGPMLRIAIPYGMLAADQLRALARVARTYDRGYGHFTTRHNFQLNWLDLKDAPTILESLARVQLHAIQTSGSCIRNISCDPLAGAAADESVDPRPWCELLRQWSAGHPEFAYLPRKLKIAVTGASSDRAAIQVHDIGISALRNGDGEIGFRILVGGGLGRTPRLAQEIEPFLPWQHLLSYCESICRVYNLAGRRDNLYKSRLKILVDSIGIAEFRRRVAAEWSFIKDGPLALTRERLDPVASHFAPKPYLELPAHDPEHRRALGAHPAFAAWVRHNVQAHRRPGYAIVTVSTKRRDDPPGDVTAGQMLRIAQWADEYSFGEIRVTQRQNLVLADVRRSDLYALWTKIRETGIADPNSGLLTDIVACPGGDYCSLANARTITLANAIAERFADQAQVERLGPIAVNLSGCMNGCAHHHLGNIGIRGIDKQGAEYYQIGIGGISGRATGFGDVIGPALPADRVPAAIERLTAVYLAYRRDGESFVETVARIGSAPFKTAAYGTPNRNRETEHA
jgi:sulfite reductase (NADPH) hemoprotein beta-component